MTAEEFLKRQARLIEIEAEIQKLKEEYDSKVTPLRHEYWLLWDDDYKRESMRKDELGIYVYQEKYEQIRARVIEEQQTKELKQMGTL